MASAGAANLQNALIYGMGVSYATLLILSSLLVFRGILPNIKTATLSLREIVEGDFKSEICIQQTGEVGRLLRAVKVLQIRQGYMINDARQQLNVSGRIQTALDNITANVMMADNDHCIFYINDTLQTMLQASEANFRKVLPNFDAKQLMGQCIDMFHKDPAHQRRILDSLTTTFTSADMNLGGTWVRIIINPIFDTQGNRMGTVTEWLDRTQDVVLEQLIEKDVKGMVEAIKSQICCKFTLR